MSADDTAKHSADEWVSRFVALAKRMQMATGKPDPNRPRGPLEQLSDDNRQATKELGAMLVSIRGALTQSQIDALLDDEDRDVKLVAALSLGSKNEERRLSAIKAALLGVSTAEILTKRARARSKLTALPRIDDRGADELVANLLDACERKVLADRFLDWGTNTADRKTCDQRLIEIVEVQETLRARGLAAFVAPLMDNENSQARMSAALICLELDEAKALATLESVEKTGGLRERGDARLLLMQLGKKSM